MPKQYRESSWRTITKFVWQSSNASHKELSIKIHIQLGGETTTAYQLRPQQFRISSSLYSSAPWKLYFWLDLFFIKNGPTPVSFSFIFGLFQTNISTIIQQINVKKCTSRDLNPRPSELESPPITTRPGLPPSLDIFVGVIQFSVSELNGITEKNLSWFLCHLLLRFESIFHSCLLHVSKIGSLVSASFM